MCIRRFIFLFVTAAAPSSSSSLPRRTRTWIVFVVQFPPTPSLYIATRYAVEATTDNCRQFFFSCSEEVARVLAICFYYHLLLLLLLLCICCTFVARDYFMSANEPRTNATDCDTYMNCTVREVACRKNGKQTNKKSVHKTNENQAFPFTVENYHQNHIPFDLNFLETATCQRCTHITFYIHRMTHHRRRCRCQCIIEWNARRARTSVNAY